jgi:hypothetical protein
MLCNFCNASYQKLRLLTSKLLDSSKLEVLFRELVSWRGWEKSRKTSVRIIVVSAEGQGRADNVGTSDKYPHYRIFKPVTLLCRISTTMGPFQRAAAEISRVFQTNIQASTKHYYLILFKMMPSSTESAEHRTEVLCMSEEEVAYISGKLARIHYTIMCLILHIFHNCMCH